MREWGVGLWSFLRRDKSAPDATSPAPGGETYVVTRKGAIIKRLETGDPTDLPIVTGR